MNSNGSGSVERDIVFGRGGNMDLKLNVYRPAPETSKRTAIIHLHGGGFRGGNKEAVERTAEHLVQRGYVCISSQYRIADQAKWPAQIQDAKAAIRWTRANAANLGIDPDKIVIAGYSAGAHLSLNAAGNMRRPDYEGDGGNAGVSSDVAACIAYYPPTVTARDANIMPPDASEDFARDASPSTHIGANMPPTILLHATGDTTLPFSGSVQIFEKLRASGVAVELHLFDGLSHVFDRHPEFAAPAAELCDLFLDRHVVEPREYPPFTGGAPATPAAATR
jgi:acetyl esterase/lipase